MGMADRDAMAVVLEFVEKINSGDVEKVAALMSEDHVFVDGLGNRVVGREKMRAGWRGYYQMVPDYKISHEEIFANGNVVAVFGTARGTDVAPGGAVKKENSWEVPAAWKAVVRNGEIAVWQVYADNQPVRKLMGAPVA
jgi:uncharacterized protein (TIGR02246 family)